MFDIGGLEMAVIALMALIIIGPKDLPRLLRTVGQWVRKAKSLAREFQSGLDDIVKEADLEDAKKTITGGSDFNIKKAVSDAVDPSGSLDKELRDVESAAKSTISGSGDKASGAKSTATDYSGAAAGVKTEAPRSATSKTEAPEPDQSKTAPAAKKTEAKPASDSPSASKSAVEPVGGNAVSGNQGTQKTA